MRKLPRPRQSGDNFMLVRRAASSWPTASFRSCGDGFRGGSPLAQAVVSSKRLSGSAAVGGALVRSTFEGGREEIEVTGGSAGNGDQGERAPPRHSFGPRRPWVVVSFLEWRPQAPARRPRKVLEKRTRWGGVDSTCGATILEWLADVSFGSILRRGRAVPRPKCIAHIQALGMWQASSGKVASVEGQRVASQEGASESILLRSPHPRHAPIAFRPPVWRWRCWE